MITFLFAGIFLLSFACIAGIDVMIMHVSYGATLYTFWRQFRNIDTSMIVPLLGGILAAILTDIRRHRNNRNKNNQEDTEGAPS